MHRANSFLPTILSAGVAIFWAATGTFTPAADGGKSAPKATMDYLEPRLLTGTIYSDSSLRKILFTFRRSATNSGPTIRVLREYFLPDGTLAARERVLYESGRLVSYDLGDLQSGAAGSAVIRPDPKDSNVRKINFDYTEGPDRGKKTDVERLQPDTLINDMLAPFILAHWTALTNGATVKFRFVALARRETVGFKLEKLSEGEWQGKRVIRLRMEPSSLIIAQFIEPLIFTIEKDGAHRILNYTGRITPGVRRNGGWEDFDAFTVFDWK